MFRTTKKKKNVNGGRKRVIEEEEHDQNQINEETSLKEDGQVKDDVKMEINEEKDVETVEEIDHGDMLERARQRMKNAKTKNSFAMKFSSKSTLEKKEGSKSNTQSMSGGTMSFEQEEDNTMTRKIGKIRPNLMKDNRMEQEEQQEEDAKQKSYSVEMLESLRKEQKVLLRPLGDQGPEEEDIEMTGTEEDKDDIGPQQEYMESMDVDMEVDQEEKKEEDAAEEEFIPLHSKMMKDRKRRNRVTFGVQETHMPDLSRPVEDTPLSDLEDDEEQEQSRRWEEELMRRGGHATHPKQSSFSRKSDEHITYPTKRAVPCTSLSEITMKLQKQLEQSAFENDRTNRDLARLDSEAILLEQNLVKQREELLVSSEQFEYFQEIEDYVKGLSFCLREKLVLIQKKEKDMLDQRSQAFKRLCDLEDKDTLDHVRTMVALGHLSLDDITADSKLLASVKDHSVNPTISQDETERILKFQGCPEDFSKAVVTAISMVQSDPSIDYFEDAIEDMNSLDHVYGKFQEWKHKFPQVYTEVYCDMALPKLYAPFVQAELLQWEPLLVDSSWKLEKMVWFRTLTQHFRVAEASDGMSNVVTSILKDVVISRIEKSLDGYFDPFTRVHVSSFITLLKQLKSYGSLITESEKLVGTIRDTFSQAVGKLLLISTSNTDGSTSEFASYQVQKLFILLQHLVLLVVSDVDVSLVLFVTLAILKQFLMRSKQLQKTRAFSIISPRMGEILNDNSIQSCSNPSHKQQLIQWKQELTVLLSVN